MCRSCSKAHPQCGDSGSHAARADNGGARAVAQGASGPLWRYRGGETASAAESTRASNATWRALKSIVARQQGVDEIGADDHGDHGQVGAFPDQQALGFIEQEHRQHAQHLPDGQHRKGDDRVGGELGHRDADIGPQRHQNRSGRTACH
jgi:hypothetical protein